jgi:hypothetical protein
MLAAMPTIGEAASVAAKTFGAVATAPVQVVPLSHVVDVALQAMLEGWKAPLIAQEVRRAAAQEFRLMWHRFREIDQACAALFRAQSRPPIIDPK